MLQSKRSMWTITLRSLIVIGCGLLLPSTAAAGTYEVTQTCGAWQPVNNAPDRIAIYTECPTLIVRNVGGAFSARPGQEARWEFFAPTGAVVDNVFLAGGIQGLSGWQATILSSSGPVLETCPGFQCAGGGKSYGDRYNLFGSAGVYLRLRCGADRCPNGEGLKGYLDAHTAKVVVADSTPPGGGITGGDLLDGWRRGVGTVTFDHVDNVGIRFDRILVDGAQRGQSGRPCADGLKVPCPNGPGSLQLDTSLISDGAHVLRVEAVDSAGNVGGQERRITVDNTAPSRMLDFSASNGWRATNAFEMSWRNPVQAHAPIAGIGYELCPGDAASGSKACMRGNRSGADLAKLTDFELPGPGEWRSRIWLRDAAGNEDPRTAVDATFGFDNTAPTLAFQEQTADDPTLVRLEASDSISGVDHADVEIRRRGEDAWRTLPATRADGGFTARVDDEHLPRGLYDLRARVVDRAGNERSATSRTNGQPAVLELPLRTRATLRVGRPGHRLCRGHGRRRSCHRRLVGQPSVGFGHSTRVLGRLRSRGRPLAGVSVRVWSRTDLPGARERRVARLRTTRLGLIRFRAPAGPARTLRFRYGGNAHVQGADGQVELRVRGTSTLRSSRRLAVNGEYVTFRGRVRGKPLPADGKLVELQVYTRRRWRTFAQPRANARTGRWTFQYRFESIRGRVSFRFRARVRRELGYPFRTGTSRSVRVVVRGL